MGTIKQHNKGRAPTRRRRVAALAATLAAAGSLAVVASSPASAAGTTGVMVAQNLSVPGGGAFLPGGGGHFWVSDGVNGLCEVLPASLSVTKCNGAGKGGQVVYDAAKGLVYQADTTTKTNQVMRFPYTSSNDSLGGSTRLTVANLTSVGGGAGGGRAMGLALVTAADGTQHLYVGYLKSGDIMDVVNPSGKNAAGATVNPTVTKIGNTSDGRGVTSLTSFTYKDGSGVRHDDLYVGESGGAGLSVIKDVDGSAGRPACGSGATPCGATTVTGASGGALFSFPGGLDSDANVIYVADAPRNTPGQVLTWNPVTGAQGVLSTDISPAYTSSFDNTRRTRYQNITGLALDPSTRDVYVGDDPSFPLATPITGQGHLWKISGSARRPVVTSVSSATGDIAGGTTVTITGTNLANSVAGASDPTAFGTTVSFGSLAGTGVTCTTDGTSCTAVSPAAPGTGVVDIRVTNVDQQTSVVAAADQFTYTQASAPASSAPVISAISPASGVSVGGTKVTITGTNLVNADGTSAVSFGTDAATGVTCATDGTSCTALSPGGPDGSTVDVQVTTAVAKSSVVAADKFTYRTPVGKLFASGITAPKGGLTWIPDTTSAGGHYWISDHGNGLCRLDTVPGTTVTAPNTAACDPGFTIGSPGQAVYDSRANADGTHWIYVPDNAVRSPGVWRLTFDPATATVSNPVAMAPGLMDNLKTNSLALDTTKDVLYVGDLVDGNIRRINKIGGDPRSQTVSVIATTQPAKPGAAGRGINGTMAVLGNRLYLPENNAATYVDLTAACANPTVEPNPNPCSTTTVNFLSTPAAVFVAGIATDAVHHFVYISESPGTANSTIYRFDDSTITSDNPGGAPAIVYVTQGKVPAAGTPDAIVYCSLTCTRPADPALTPGGTTGFPFAQGLYVDPNNSKLYVTEDASAGARSGRGHAWEVPFTP